jgi:hypothetical protein
VSTPSTCDSNAPRSSSLATAERIYRVILRAYPDAFRAEYGREMTQLFADQWREGGGDVLHFWMNVALDLVRSAPALRVEAWRARDSRTTRAIGETMKLVAILTVLFGLFGALSAASEGVMGVRQGALGTAYLLSVTLSVVAGALLLTAGVAVLRGTPSGQRTASRAAIASLVVFLVARMAFGWMSVLVQLAGIVLPLAALAVLHQPLWRRTAS